jgi:hypothetical protein
VTRLERAWDEVLKEEDHFYVTSIMQKVSSGELDSRDQALSECSF